MTKLIFGVALVAASSVAWSAAAVNDLLVDLVHVDGSTGYVRFVSSLGGAPAACGAAHTQELGFSLTSSGGKSLLALVTAAKMSGAKITATGTGACTSYSDFEDLNYGLLE
jgi:hypothetical protein